MKKPTWRKKALTEGALIKNEQATPDEFKHAVND